MDESPGVVATVMGVAAGYAGAAVLVVLADVAAAALSVSPPLVMAPATAVGGLLAGMLAAWFGSVTSSYLLGGVMGVMGLVYTLAPHQVDKTEAARTVAGMQKESWRMKLFMVVCGAVLPPVGGALVLPWLLGA